MNHFLSRRESSRRGFSLIEMLVVITIVVMLLALATPALTRTLQASRLSSAGEALLGALSEAQQTAVSMNSPVEVRFFSFKDDLDQSPVFHSYQLFKITQTDTGGTGGTVQIQEALTPAGNLITLPEGIIIPSDTTLSGAFAVNGTAIAGVKDAKQGSQVGYSGVSGATYNALRFMPDSSCMTVGATPDGSGMASVNFQSVLTTNCLTITFGSGTPVTQANLPKNFFVIQIDPYTGKLRSYKPGF